MFALLDLFHWLASGAGGMIGFLAGRPHGVLAGFAGGGMKGWRWVALLGCAMLAAGCAGDTGGAVERERQGMVYYEPAPYLLVEVGEAGHVVARVIYLPDMTKPRMIRSSGFRVWDGETKIVVGEDGMLKEEKRAAEATVIPKAMLEAMNEAAVDSLRNFSKGNDRIVGKGHYLFKIVKGVDGSFELEGAPARGAQRVFELERK